MKTATAKLTAKLRKLRKLRKGKSKSRKNDSIKLFNIKDFGILDLLPGQGGRVRHLSRLLENAHFGLG